jgi:hypothetical protein
MPYKGRGVYILDSKTPQSYDETLQTEHSLDFTLKPKWDDIEVVFDSKTDFVLSDAETQNWWRTNLEYGLHPNQMLELLLPVLNGQIENFHYTQHTQSFDGKLSFQGHDYWCDAKATNIDPSKHAHQVGLSPNQVEHVRLHPSASAIVRGNWIGPNNGLSANIQDNTKGLLIRVLTSRPKVGYESNDTFDEYLDRPDVIDIPDSFNIAKKAIGANKRKYFNKIIFAENIITKNF